MNRSHGLDTSRYIAVTSRNGVRDRARLFAARRVSEDASWFRNREKVIVFVQDV
jgi:hypothetical protein